MERTLAAAAAAAKSLQSCLTLLEHPLLPHTPQKMVGGPALSSESHAGPSLEDTTRMFSRPYGYLYQETPRAPASWEGRKGILVLLCENRDIDYANPLDNPERWGGEGSG